MEKFKLYGLDNKESFIDRLSTSEIPMCDKTERVGDYKQTIEYINLPAAYDIETSSFYMGNDKAACMYLWQFGINGRVVVGRTWGEFIDLINELVKTLELGFEKRLVVYVHNLGHEFEWIRKRFNWSSIFAREKGFPIKALTTNGIEFRCSYMLSGKNLERTCKGLTKYKMNKKVGDLDYNLIRTPITPLTDKELGYGVYDVLGVMAYVQEEIETYEDIAHIPMTATGKVRLYCRNKCFSKESRNNYRYLMNSLILTGKNEYSILKRAFTAGYVHANWMNANEVWENVMSKDITSSYPAVMVGEKMPMSRGEWITVENINQIENMSAFDYYVIFNVRLKNVKEKFGIPDHYISLSKCYNCKNYKTDNGRIISADTLDITLTSDDWDIFKMCYDFDDDITIGRCIRYRLGYLPKPIVECILELYGKKTLLKGQWETMSDPEEAAECLKEYADSKENLNCVFGMTVTDIVSDDIGYEDEWIANEEDELDCVVEYNKSKSRFLFYPWGIAICSKARKRLWAAILELGDDYLYCDTDSVYYNNREKHEAFFEKANAEMQAKIKAACDYHKIDFELTRPETKDGVKKPLGDWDNNVKGIEPTYRKFKTLGAKRYLVEYVDEEGSHISATISGANKDKSSEYISSQKNPFDFFSDKMNIDSKHSGRLTHTRLADIYNFTVIDYLGNSYTGTELSGIHLEPSDYNLSLSPIYALLLGEREQRI